MVSTSGDQLTTAETGVTHVYTAFGITPSPTFANNTAFLPIASFNATGTETEIYWFHPDHLGSSNYITNFVGEVSQHMEYFAFGETFIEEHKNSHNSPYKFNGKELDEESGYTYYGARYLDMRYSIWTATDPLSGYNPIFEKEHYIDGQHNGGYENSYNHNTYGYCYQNPINLIDPNGKQVPPTYGLEYQYVDHDKVQQMKKYQAAGTLAGAAVWAGAYVVATYGLRAIGTFILNEAKDEALSQATGGASDILDLSKLTYKGLKKLGKVLSNSDLLELSFKVRKEIFTSKPFKSGDKDTAADELVKKIGGESSMKFAGADKEFDVVTDRLFGETKTLTGSGGLGKHDKYSLRALFAAAKASGRGVYIELRGSGRKYNEYLQKVNEYAKKWNVKTTIDK